MQKFISKICIRKYSGEYRIFNFKGFTNLLKGDKKPKESDTIPIEPVKNERKLPDVAKPASTPLQKVLEVAQKICTSAEKHTRTLALKKEECNKKEVKKKPPNKKCLRPVPRLKPVNGPPHPCNVEKTKVPSIKLNDGCVMPMIGLGTWGAQPHQASKAVMKAIKVGYRMIDCAHVYQNEKAVGKAINKAIKKCIVTRDELFITSKLWNTFHRPALVMEGCERTLNDLKLSYLNLYLIHWPMGYKEGIDLIPHDACGRVLASRIDYVDTWQAMEELVKRGYTRSIGVSNFNKQQIERILKIAKIQPVVNQVECHPYLNQKRLMAYLKKKKIALVAYSPLGSPARPWAKPDEPNILADKAIQRVAYLHDRTEAQICIRYQIQRGNIVIPKSVTPSRIESNYDVADFELSGHEMKMLDGLDRQFRLVTLLRLSNHPYYPFHDKY